MARPATVEGVSRARRIRWNPGNAWPRGMDWGSMLCTAIPGPAGHAGGRGWGGQWRWVYWAWCEAGAVLAYLAHDDEEKSLDVSRAKLKKAVSDLRVLEHGAKQEAIEV